MPADKPVHVYIPDNFDPASVLPAELAGYADCARYFVHRIIWARVQRNVRAEGYVPLKWDYLREVIPDRVLNCIKTALMTGGVIDCDNHYIEGRKAFGYRLCPPYCEAEIVRTPIENPRMVERVRRNRTVDHRKVKLDVHKYLRSQLSRLEIDLPRAVQILEGYAHNKILKIPAEQIAAKDISCSVCRFGRFHSDLTRCLFQKFDEILLTWYRPATDFRRWPAESASRPASGLPAGEERTNFVPEGRYSALTLKPRSVTHNTWV